MIVEAGRVTAGLLRDGKDKDARGKAPAGARSQSLAQAKDRGSL